jgi:hypothetical protein
MLYMRGKLCWSRAWPLSDAASGQRWLRLRPSSTTSEKWSLTGRALRNWQAQRLAALCFQRKDVRALN